MAANSNISSCSEHVLQQQHQLQEEDQQEQKQQQEQTRLEHERLLLWLAPVPLAPAAEAGPAAAEQAEEGGLVRGGLRLSPSYPTHWATLSIEGGWAEAVMSE